MSTIDTAVYHSDHSPSLMTRIPSLITLLRSPMMLALSVMTRVPSLITVSTSLMTWIPSLITVLTSLMTRVPSLVIYLLSSTHPATVCTQRGMKAARSCIDRSASIKSAVSQRNLPTFRSITGIFFSPLHYSHTLPSAQLSKCSSSSTINQILFAPLDRARRGVSASRSTELEETILGGVSGGRSTELGEACCFRRFFAILSPFSFVICRSGSSGRSPQNKKVLVS